jgi:hypothetical protein
LEVIKDTPVAVGHGLDAFCALFIAFCGDRTISRIPDAGGKWKACGKET